MLVGVCVFGAGRKTPPVFGGQSPFDGCALVASSFSLSGVSVSPLMIRLFKSPYTVSAAVSVKKKVHASR